MLLSAAGVVVGAWWAGGALAATPPVVDAATAAAALAALANSANDVADVAIDRVAHPERPLPSGALSLGAARRVVGSSAVIALAASWVAGGGALAGATAAIATVMLAYGPMIKRHGVAGNAVVALLASLPFAYGGAAVRAIAPTLALVAIAAPLHFARELAKDLDDAAGDAGHRRTLPLTRGVRVTRVALSGALALFFTAATIAGMRWPGFFAPAAPAIFVAALGGARVARGRPGAPTLFKAAMALSLVALTLTPRP